MQLTRKDLEEAVLAERRRCLRVIAKFKPPPNHCWFHPHIEVELILKGIKNPRKKKA